MKIREHVCHSEERSDEESLFLSVYALYGEILRFTTPARATSFSARVPLALSEARAGGSGFAQNDIRTGSAFLDAEKLRNGRF